MRILSRLREYSFVDAAKENVAWTRMIPKYSNLTIIADRRFHFAMNLERGKPINNMNDTQSWVKQY